MMIVINPFSKMLVASLMGDKIKKKNVINRIINYSNLIALSLLLVFALLGPFIFRELFNITNTALSVASGVSLFIFGVNYLFKDEVFNLDYKDESVMYLSIGTPLITGPASISTITVISSYSSFWYAGLISLLAVVVNYALMIITYKYLPVKPENEKIHYLTTRLTGLFMLAVGTQFILDGLSTWLNSV